MLYTLVKILRSLVLKKIEVFFDEYIFKTALRAIGFGVVLTIMVQSSSITTSLVVPLAGAGVLTLRQICVKTAWNGLFCKTILTATFGQTPSGFGPKCYLSCW